MSIVFDEVTADVSTPERETTEDTGSSEALVQVQHVKREVLQAIERNKYRELRVKAD